MKIVNLIIFAIMAMTANACSNPQAEIGGKTDNGENKGDTPALTDEGKFDLSGGKNGNLLLSD